MTGPIFTVGHSTRSAQEFVGMLTAHGVKLLADVRTVPRSRHNPQFNRDVLPETLKAAGIDYVHIAELGGLRKPRPDSTNMGWRNLSFRGYADYMETPAFEAALNRLLDAAAGRRAAIMCAEAVPWRCHRSLIGDALEARGVEVFEIASATRSQPHRMTPFALIKDGQVTYSLLSGDRAARER